MAQILYNQGGAFSPITLDMVGATENVMVVNEDGLYGLCSKSAESELNRVGSLTNLIYKGTLVKSQIDDGAFETVSPAWYHIEKGWEQTPQTPSYQDNTQPKQPPVCACPYGELFVFGLGNLSNINNTALQIYVSVYGEIAYRLRAVEDFSQPKENNVRFAKPWHYVYSGGLLNSNLGDLSEGLIAIGQDTSPNERMAGSIYVQMV